MPPRNLKSSYLVVEGLNSFAIVFFFYYLYFYMQKVFGFDNSRNLMLAASTGAINMLASWWGGRFAQRFGYFTALKLGFVTMMVAQAAGAQVESVRGQVLVMAGTV